MPSWRRRSERASTSSPPSRFWSGRVGSTTIPGRPSGQDPYDHGRALGWALGRLDALAEKVERTTKIGDLAKAAKEAESEVQELLAVVARCFELQDALDVLLKSAAAEAGRTQNLRKRVSRRWAPPHSEDGARTRPKL